MWIPTACRTIASLDISELAAELDVLPDSYWEADEKLRQAVTGGRETKAIFFRSILTSDSKEKLAKRPLADADITRFHHGERIASSVQRLVDAALSHLPKGGIVTRVQLARMQPGARIEPHTDSSPILVAAHRLHVPITTNADVEFMVDGERVVMEAGKLCELNNRRPHWVNNHGDHQRTHLIIDYLPAEHNHPRSLSPSFERRRKQLARERTTPKPPARADVKLPKLIATSVIRGADQNESHGSVYLVDLQSRQVDRVIDWNTCDIAWEGRGADRGLRGIAFHGEHVYIAASDELLCFDKQFNKLASYRNHYLKHAHEIVRHDNYLLVTSTGFDSILRFDLDKKRFDHGWVVRLHPERGLVYGQYNPQQIGRPHPGNTLHVNQVFADHRGVFASGRGLVAMVHLGPSTLGQYGELPPGTHNAQPYNGGLLFNDTSSDLVVFQTKNEFRSIEVPYYTESELLHRDKGDDRLARQAFARGLCVYRHGSGEDIVIAGSSPSTVTAYDLRACAPIRTLNLTMDVRNAIHGLEIWPF